MIVNKSDKRLFVHVPKVGGSTVRDYLCRHGFIGNYSLSIRLATNYAWQINPHLCWKYNLFSKHGLPTALREVDFSDYVLGGMIRNPIIWLKSLYFYNQRTLNRGSSLAKRFSFDEWLGRHIKGQPMRQCDFFRESCRFKETVITAFDETSGSIQEFLIEFLGEPLDSPIKHLNSNPSKNEGFFEISDTSHKLMSAYFAEDIELYESKSAKDNNSNCMP